MVMKSLKIGEKIAKYPIIQGGMGVGVSRSRLAGAVAKEGGIGIISTAQVGYDEPNFEENPLEANLHALTKHIKEAKRIGEGGLVGVNIMAVTREYGEYVETASKAGADVIISGAGLPITLPEHVRGYDTKIAPIVSSEKAASVILRMWDRKYQTTADFVVIEGPRAGGHLGFSKEQLEDVEHLNYDVEIDHIMKVVKTFGEKYERDIPIIIAGGIFNKEDIKHYLELGADGVQIASRFVATKECDASDEYKQAYINAAKSDIGIVVSPVGMPGRAVYNKFIHSVKDNKKPVSKCIRCLAHCNPSETPYCITRALINAVKGDLDNGLIFCGDSIDRIHEITTVNKLMQELVF